jgi:transposase InsO family protein
MNELEDAIATGGSIAVDRALREIRGEALPGRGGRLCPRLAAPTSETSAVCGRNVYKRRLTDRIPPPARNHRTPTAGETPAAAAASSLDAPAATARQHRCRSSRRATDGRPGDRIRGRPARSAARRRTAPIATLLIEALRRPLELGQYTSIDYTQTLDDHRVLASVGSVGDALDNALAESFVDSFKTELIADRVWRTRSQLELAVVEYIGWFNHDRLHESLGDEYEQRWHATNAANTPNPAGQPVARPAARPAERLTAPRLRPVAAENGQNGADHRPTAPVKLAIDTLNGAENDSGSRMPLKA